MRSLWGGFLTKVKSRPLRVDTLKESLRDESLLVHREQTLDELHTFVVTVTGRFEATSGSHDDRDGFGVSCLVCIPDSSPVHVQASSSV